MQLAPTKRSEVERVWNLLLEPGPIQASEKLRGFLRASGTLFHDRTWLCNRRTPNIQPFYHAWDDVYIKKKSVVQWEHVCRVKKSFHWQLQHPHCTDLCQWGLFQTSSSPVPWAGCSLASGCILGALLQHTWQFCFIWEESHSRTPRMLHSEDDWDIYIKSTILFRART